MTQNNDQSKKASAIFDVLEAKMNNAKFNAETSQKDLDKANTELEKMLMLLDAKHNQIKVLTENRDLNQRKYDLMLSKKHETIAVADALENLGADCAEVAIAIYRQGKPTPPTPTPPPTETEPQPQPQPEPIAAKANDTLPGDTASEQIANIPPVEKKPEAPEEQQSELLPAEAADKIIENCFEIDGYSFKFDNKNFEFFTPDKQRFEGIWSDEKPAPIGLKTGSRKLFVSTLHPQEWLTDWDAHLFAIEKALQQFTKNADFRVKFPARTTSNLEKTPWRADGCILLPMDSTAIKLTQKIDGYTVSFKEAKDFKVSGKQHTSITLKVLGENTGSNGIEVNCSFKEGQEYFIVAVKLPDGTQSNDKTSTKRAEMPKWLKPLRRCAIQWMVSNFPYTAAKWEDEVNYVTPAPQTTDKQPSNAAAEPVK